MKYTIISIDDSREEYKKKIRREMEGVEEIFVKCLDARPLEVDLNKELKNIGVKFATYWKNLQWKRGDIGGFVSHFNAWQQTASLKEPLLVFEDDAILPDNFLNNIELLLTEVPSDYGIVSFCVNDYGKHFYYNRVEYDEWGYHYVNVPRKNDEVNQFEYGAKRMARAYQNWTMTCTLYSPDAAGSLIKTVKKMGLHMNADAFIFHRAHCGDFDAYAPKPEYLDLVAEFNEGHSLIQSSEF